MKTVVSIILLLSAPFFCFADEGFAASLSVPLCSDRFQNTSNEVTAKTQLKTATDDQITSENRGFLVENDEAFAWSTVAVGGAASAVGITTAMTATTASTLPIAAGLIGGAAVGAGAAIASPLAAVGAVGAGVGIGTSATAAGGAIGTLLGGTAGGIASSLGLAATAPVWAVPAAIAGGVAVVGGGTYLVYKNYWSDEERKANAIEVKAYVVPHYLIRPELEERTSRWGVCQNALGVVLFETIKGTMSVTKKPSSNLENPSKWAKFQNALGGTIYEAIH